MTEAAMTEAATPEGPAAENRTPRRAGLAFFGLVGILLILHLLGDRLTPYSSQGRVHAFIVPIASEVGGTISAVHVRNNQRVRRGEPLFTIGTDNFDIGIAKAQADLDATLREQQAQDAAIEASLAQRSIAVTELEKARQDWSRHERIYALDAGAISLRRLELARASYAEAGARLRAADAQVAQARAARGAIGDANDRFVAARSALSRAQLDLRRTTVRAPGDGLVTDLRADRGQFAGAGVPVMTFISVHDGWITADMTENNLGRMVVGAPAEIVLDVLPGKVLKGRVRSIGFGVSSGGKAQPGSLPDVQNNRDFLRQSQRFPVIIEMLPGQGDVVQNLREGGQAEVIVYTGENAVLNALGRLFIRAAGLLSYAY